MDPDTPAVRAARLAGLPFSVAQTQPAGSAAESARLQGIELRQLLRTIVVRRGENDYVFVLVPGGRQIDWPKLRAHLGARRLSLPTADEAREATGYERGAITPFGATAQWPVVVDETVRDLELAAIGGGVRGVNLHVDPADLVPVLRADMADVTHPDES